jgi:hypothetical protein
MKYRTRMQYTEADKADVGTLPVGRHDRSGGAHGAESPRVLEISNMYFIG